MLMSYTININLPLEPSCYKKINPGEKNFHFVKIIFFVSVRSPLRSGYMYVPGAGNCDW